MFDLVQKHKVLASILLGLAGLALALSFSGIETYTRLRGSADAAAVVNGTEITRRELDDELRRRFGADVPDVPELRNAVLEGLISQRLVALEVAKAYLTVSDEQLREAIALEPAFQLGGQFSKETYENVLRSQNPPLSPAQFEARLRNDLTLQQLMRAVGNAAIPSRTVTQRLSALEAQKREVSEARLLAQQFLPQVKVDEAKVKEYYDANPAEFRRPERVRAEYLVLSADQLARQEQVSEDELKAAYQQRLPKMTEPEQRRASHILLKSKEEADQVVAELKKNPGAFAALAKKQSQDPGSAAQGGDLGWFGPGMMVKPFEDAVFGMKQGETSGTVQSEAGFHVIRVTGVRAAKSRSFEEARAEIEAALRKERASARFNKAADEFQNTVYEQDDSLKPAAERFKLQVQTTGWIAKSSAQELGALDNPKLLAALFSPEALQKKRNTDAIEVAPATLVAARVIEHQPAAQRSFDEVKKELAEMLRQREALTLAQKDGMAKMDQLRKGEAAGLTWGIPRIVSRRDPKGLPPNLLRQVVAADVSKLPTYVGVPLESGYALLRISKVIEAGEAERNAEAEQRVGSVLGAGQFQAYVASLRARADIQVKAAKPEEKK